MNVIREHEGRYSVRNDAGELKGQILQGQFGWSFRDNRGYGPRQAKMSPVATLELATIIGFLTQPAESWQVLVMRADQAWAHNQRVTAKNPR